MRVRTFSLGLLGVVTMVTCFPAVGQAQQAAHDPRPELIEPDATAPSPEVAARLEVLQGRKRAAEGRAAGFAALTVGGIALMVGGVTALVVVAAVGPMGCTMPDDCVQPIDDFWPGITLMAIGTTAILLGAILWADADAGARSLNRQIEDLRHPVPDLAITSDGFRLRLRGWF